MRLPVALGVGAAEDPREVVEVALGGLFVATDAPHALHQLVRLRIDFRPGDALELQGMIVRVVSPDEARRIGAVPGVGIQLYGMSPAIEAAWRGFFEQGLREAAEGEGGAGEAPELELATIKDLPRYTPMPTVECEEDALAMLSQGYSPDDIARAAGLDPSIVSAALAPAPVVEEVASPAGLEPGQAVEGVSLLGSAAPELLRASAPTEPTVEAVRSAGASVPAAVSPGAQRDSSPTGPITSVIRIIGSSPPVRAAEPDAARADGADPDADTAKMPAAERVKITLRALGPLQPPAIGTVATSRPRLVAAGLVPLAPTGLLPQVVYRLEMASTAVIEAFGRASVETGKVIITPAEPRRMGTPVVVCVVHPLTRDELHLPGVVVASTDERGGVAVELAGAAMATRTALERLLAAGDLGVVTASSEPELSLVRKGVVTGREVVPAQPASKDTRHVIVTEVELLKSPPRSPEEP